MYSCQVLHFANILPGISADPISITRPSHPTFYLCIVLLLPAGRIYSSVAQRGRKRRGEREKLHNADAHYHQLLLPVAAAELESQQPSSVEVRILWVPHSIYKPLLWVYVRPSAQPARFFLFFFYISTRDQAENSSTLTQITMLPYVMRHVPSGGR